MLMEILSGKRSFAYAVYFILMLRQLVYVFDALDGIVGSSYEQQHVSFLYRLFNRPWLKPVWNLYDVVVELTEKPVVLMINGSHCVGVPLNNRLE